MTRNLVQTKIVPKKAKVLSMLDRFKQSKEETDDMHVAQINHSANLLESRVSTISGSDESEQSVRSSLTTYQQNPRKIVRSRKGATNFAIDNK